MKSLILIFAGLLLVVPCRAAEQPRGSAEQIDARLKIQQQRLKDIEELVSEERQQVEDWYARHLAELRQLAQRQAKQFIPYCRMLWTEFIRMHNQIPYADSYFKMNDQITYGNSYFSKVAQIYKIQGTKSFKLRDALMDSYFLGTTADLLMDSDFRKLLTNLADGSGYNPENPLIRSEARKLLHWVTEFDSELKRLENRRNDRLAGLEQWEKGLREDVFRVMREIKAPPETPEAGVVSAISYDSKAAACMVDGVDKILRAGDTIGNITVIKIYQDRVEFAKDGQRWVQAVGQPAKPAWR